MLTEPPPSKSLFCPMQQEKKPRKRITAIQEAFSGQSHSGTTLMAHSTCDCHEIHEHMSLNVSKINTVHCWTVA